MVDTPPRMAARTPQFDLLRTDVSIELLKHAHEVSRIRTRLSGEAAIAGLNGLMLLNGGALVALGTLLGRDRDSFLSQTLAADPALIWVTACYVVGLVCALTAFSMTWIAHDFLNTGHENKAVNYALLFMGSPPDERVAIRAARMGHLWSIATSVSASASLFCFALGSALVVDAAASAQQTAAATLHIRHAQSLGKLGIPRELR